MQVVLALLVVTALIATHSRVFVGWDARPVLPQEACTAKHNAVRHFATHLKLRHKCRMLVQQVVEVHIFRLASLPPCLCKYFNQYQYHYLYPQCQYLYPKCQYLYPKCHPRSPLLRATENATSSTIRVNTDLISIAMQEVFALLVVIASIVTHFNSIAIRGATPVSLKGAVTV